MEHALSTSETNKSETKELSDRRLVRGFRGDVVDVRSLGFGQVRWLVHSQFYALSTLHSSSSSSSDSRILFPATDHVLIDSEKPYLLGRLDLLEFLELFLGILLGPARPGQTASHSLDQLRTHRLEGISSTSGQGTILRRDTFIHLTQTMFQGTR